MLDIDLVTTIDLTLLHLKEKGNGVKVEVVDAFSLLIPDEFHDQRLTEIEADVLTLFMELLLSDS